MADIISIDSQITGSVMGKSRTFQLSGNGKKLMCKNVFNKHNSNILQITLFSLIIHFFIPLFNFVHLFVGLFIHSFISFIYQVLTQLSRHKTDNTKKPNNTSNKGQLYKHFMNTIVYIFFSNKLILMLKKMTWREKITSI